MSDPGHSGDDRDRGAILLLVLAVAIVFSLVVLALANFVAADLRYSQIIDARAKTLSSAESGIDYAVDRLGLNQTLCASNAAGGSAVSLNGSHVAPIGTPLPQPLNGTTVTVACRRLDPAIAELAGWALVIGDDGTSLPSDLIRVDMPGTVSIDGPVFVPDATRTATDSDSRIEVVNGDLWYTRASCGTPYTSAFLAGRGLDVTPTQARGGICTTIRTGPRISAPPPAYALAAPPGVFPPTIPSSSTWPFTDSTGPLGVCRVFSPGNYSTPPPLSANNYFMSGEYQLGFFSRNVWDVDSGRAVWIGGAGGSSAAPVTPNAPCQDVRDLDTGGGATLYVGSHAWIRVSGGGTFEMFGRRQGNHVVSIRALYSGTEDWVVLETSSSGTASIVTHGAVWAPVSRLEFNNDNTGSTVQFLGGLVAGRLHIFDVQPSDFEIQPATSVGDGSTTGDTRILLTSTSTSTLDGVSTTVEAVVAYRPHAPDLDERVRITSLRVVD